ncbi:pectate lyase-like [Euphorbia lathyris]|uniref:pectate lyase-like n=1 Tax=Euphorbia lathyris TaxID=212925 RepID=UPI00331409F8
MEKTLFLLFTLLALSYAVDIPELDDYWKQKAELARTAAFNSYTPDPFTITNNFNAKVNQEYSDNTTRRNLLRRKGGGPCKATNPIDRCWRCSKNWATHREKLADCALGFGHKTTGGKGGRVYIVSNPSDDDMVNPKPGTLRHAVIQDGPLWIVFDHSMIIKLNEELMVASNKTIDGRGVIVHITGGAGLTLQFVQNVIIHNIRIHDISPGNGGLIRDSMEHFGYRTRSDGDGISIFSSSNVWIDHVSMSNCSDGLIDAIMGSTAITISNSHFTRHNEVMLFGHSDGFSGDKIMQITVAFNHFGKELVQRMPRCRWGFIHVVNNDYTHWEMYAIGGSSKPTIISQGNRFIAPNDLNAKQVTKREYATQNQWMQWNWRSDRDLMMNGAFFISSGSSLTHSDFTRMQMIKSKPGTFVTRLTRYSGALDCFRGKPC